MSIQHNTSYDLFPIGNYAKAKQQQLVPSAINVVQRGTSSFHPQLFYSNIVISNELNTIAVLWSQRFVYMKHKRTTVQLIN